MQKKFLMVVLSVTLAFVFTACGSSDSNVTIENDSEAVVAFNESIDVDFAKEVMTKVSEFGDDEAVGMRSAGSPAETETAEYVKSIMEDIGLQNVTMEDITVDGWTFNGANITFTNADGEEQVIDLGGYQTTLQADNEQVEIVYLGEGTEAEYEGIDVEGKLVLIDVDQNENWWINYPAYQAKVKGAKALIAMSVYPNEGDDRIGVQDVCGPEDAPALAISKSDSEAIQAAIKESGKDSITVTFNCDSQVTKDSTSHNVWGEIPGKTDEVVFVFSHMDGYFHSTYDDAQGLSVSMAIAKAMVDSGYTPNKTIRFCVHGSEEWGVSGSEYDWSTGAYEEIMTNHPEWADNAFAIINNDGGYAVEGENHAGTRSAVELMEFAEASVGELSEYSQYEWAFQKVSTYTEDFMWARQGIPAIVAGSGEGSQYTDTGYHSSYDSFEAQPLDEAGYRETILTYGKLTIDLDELAVRPMSFTARITDFKDSISVPDEVQDAEFDQAIDDALEAAKALEAKMAEVEESGDTAAAVELNKQTQEVYQTLQDYWLGLDFLDTEAIIRHELYQTNINALDQTIASLEAGNLQEAYDEYLWEVDWAWCDMNFDEETTQYMIDQQANNSEGTWGEGLIRYPIADTGDVVRSLSEKYDQENPDVSAEITELKEIRALQAQYLEETYADEKAGLEKATERMKKYSK